MRQLGSFLFLLLIGLQLFAQSDTTDEVMIKVHPHYDGALLDLSHETFYSPEQNLTLETLRFYLSNFAFLQDGKAVWQEAKSYHLVDAAAPSTYSLLLTPPPGLAYDSISFCLGTDSLTNVSGAMEGDLDPTKGMYWAWNSGYINFKLEGNHPDCPTRNHAFQFHLGGYMPPHQTVQAVQLAADPAQPIAIALDVAALLEHLDLKEEHTIMSPSNAGKELSVWTATLFQNHEVE